MKHKIIPMIVCLMLCVALMPAAAYADNAKTTPAEPPGIWTDHAAAAFAGGSGTAGDPYQIATPQQMAKLAKDINAGKYDEVYNGDHFKLMTDIDLSAHRWIPIGRGIRSLNRTVFTGYFDGNEKVIKGLYVDESEDHFSAGLFGFVRGYEIKDLTIEDGYVKTVSNQGCTEGAGILVGAAQSGSGIRPNIKNCFVSGIVESSDAETGGLVGDSHEGTYEDCTADVEIRGAYSAGGFVGEDRTGIYRNCTAKGNVSGTLHVGGFAGHMEYKSNLDHCFAQGKVTASDTGAGGFAGYLEYAIVVNNCVAAGDVKSTFQGDDPNVGGFAGEVDARYDDVTVSNSHAAGKVTSAKTDYKPGGFVGGFYGFSITYTHFNACSYDVEKNLGIEAIGGETSADVDGVDAVSSQVVKDKICKDYYGKHIVKEVAEKPATCTEDGQKAYWKCENCGRLFADEKGSQQIEKPAVIPATGHNFGEWKVTKEATATEKGEKERVCARCQFVEKAEIPAIGTSGTTDPAKETQDNADKSAETGDDSNAALYGILALLAAGGAAGMLYRKRRA